MHLCVLQTYIWIMWMSYLLDQTGNFKQVKKEILRLKFALMPFLYLKRMHLFSTISCLHSDTKSIYRHAHLLHNWLICAASSVYLPVLEMQWFTNTHVWNVGDCRRKCTWHLKKNSSKIWIVFRTVTVVIS